jgi:hypothetical protein
MFLYYEDTPVMLTEKEVLWRTNHLLSLHMTRTA